jgi:hypothetical protein
MTVHELRFRLAQLDGSAHIMVSIAADPKSEIGLEPRVFEIKNVSMSRGTPTTDEEGRGGFSFGNTGPANWLFISVAPA